MVEIKVYSKKFKKSDGNKFSKNFAITPNGNVIECNLTNDCKDKMIKDKQVTPVVIRLEDSDYFMKKATYTKNDGTKGTKDIIVVLDYHGIEPYDMPRTSLEEVDQKITASKEEKNQAPVSPVETTEDIADEDLPF